MPGQRPASKASKAAKAKTSGTKRGTKSPAKETASDERLQKVLAAAGIGSRRDCEALILEGRVEVDGQIVQELGTRVDPVTQRIRVDGTALPAPRRVYYILNKPSGVLCTNNDPSGRARAVDLIRSNERLFTVGRLDQASEGLILLTNDGELSNRLTHPRYGIEKVYRVRVAGIPEAAVLAKLKRGIHFAEGVAKVSDVRIKNRQKQSSVLEIVLNEGRNREIRRLLARIGHKVLSLTRIGMGPLRLSDLPSGAHRKLTRDEVKSLRDAVLAPGIRPNRSSAKKSTNVRVKPPRATSRPISKAKPKTAKKAAREPERAKIKSRDIALSDQAPVGVILGGDEPLPKAKEAAPRRPNKSNTKQVRSGKSNSRQSNRGKPAKKGRR